MQHFESRFKEDVKIRPKLRSEYFRKLDHVDSSILESSLSMAEVKQAVWNCSSSKASGPDGLNFMFIKRYWDIFKDDFYNYIKYFESSCQLARGCNPSFMVLIPKKNDPLEISDYRPISLIGCVYKVISKILSMRLTGVISKVVSPNQTAFLEGRQILDGVLIANEIVRLANSEKQKMLLFKVDFEKAFDSVHWEFLLDIMI